MGLSGGKESRCVVDRCDMGGGGGVRGRLKLLKLIFLSAAISQKVFCGHFAVLFDVEREDWRSE